MNTINKIRKISAELQKVANEELNEDPDKIEEEIEHIRDWLTKQPHIKGRTDSQWLLGNIRSCKHNMQKTKQKLDAFYTQRTRVPMFFEDRNPFSYEMQKMLALGLILPLPTPHNGRRICFYQTGCYEPKDTLLALKVKFMILEILLLEEDNYVMNGSVVIGDLKSLTYNHTFPYFDEWRQFYHCIFHGYPARVKEAYLLSLKPFAATFTNIFKTLITDKLNARLYAYGERKYEQLYEKIPQKYMPKDYGGENGSIEELTAFWKKKVESYHGYFAEELNYRSDESKREVPLKHYDNIFGEQGTFRKLNID